MKAEFILLGFLVFILLFIGYIIYDARKVERWLNKRDRDYDKELRDYERKE